MNNLLLGALIFSVISLAITIWSSVSVNSIYRRIRDLERN